MSEGQCFSCGQLRKFLNKEGKCIFCTEGYGGETKETPPTKEDVISNKKSIEKYEESQKDR